MKKIIVLFLTLTLSISLLGCAPRTTEEAMQALQDRVEELQQYADEETQDLLNQIDESIDKSEETGEDEEVFSDTTQKPDEEEPQESETPVITIMDAGNIIPQTTDEIYLFAIAVYKDYLDTLQDPESVVMISYVIKQFRDVSPMNPGSLSKYELEEVAYYFTFTYWRYNSAGDYDGEYHVKYVLEKDGDLYTDGKKNGNPYYGIDLLKSNCDQYFLFELETWKLGKMALADVMQTDDTQSANSEKGLSGIEWATYDENLTRVYVEDSGMLYRLFMIDDDDSQLDLSQIPVFEEGDRLICGEPNCWSFSIIPVNNDGNGGVDTDWSSEKKTEVIPELGINYFAFIDLPDDMMISNMGLYYIYVEDKSYGSEPSQYSYPGLYRGFVFIDDECF